MLHLHRVLISPPNPRETVFFVSNFNSQILFHSTRSIIFPKHLQTRIYMKEMNFPKRPSDYALSAERAISVSTKQPPFLFLSIGANKTDDSNCPQPRSASRRPSRKRRTGGQKCLPTVFLSRLFRSSNYRDPSGARYDEGGFQRHDRNHA